MQPWSRRIHAVYSAVMTYLQTLTRRALALVALAALLSHGVAARADEVQPFFLCEKQEALELAAAYETSHEAVIDTMVRLPVPERCVRHPPGWTFEVAEIVAGPLRSFDGLRFYVVQIDIQGARPLFGLTWRRLGETAPKGQPM